MLEGLQKPSQNRLCGVAKKREALDDGDKQILDDALTDSTWSSFQLQRALAAKGFNTAVETLRSHRAGTCICSKT